MNRNSGWLDIPDIHAPTYAFSLPPFGLFGGEVYVKDEEAVEINLERNSDRYSKIRRWLSIGVWIGPGLVDSCLKSHATAYMNCL
jgi:hypothetical protein